jgi:hypothetical protein
MIDTRTIFATVLLVSLPACWARSENCSLLEEHIDALTISVGLYPFGSSHDGDPGGGLRGVILHQGNILLEPHAYWGRDGGPISSDAQISRETMIALVEDFDRLGVWENVERHYSNRRKEPRSDPWRWPEKKGPLRRVEKGPLGQGSCAFSGGFRTTNTILVDFSRFLVWKILVQENTKLVDGSTKMVFRNALQKSGLRVSDAGTTDQGRNQTVG